MKANRHHEVILISIIFMTLTAGLIFTFQVLEPGLYDLTGQATVGTRVNITNVTQVPCNFTLQNGLNLVSFFCVGNFIEVDDAFSNLTQMTGIWGYSKGASDSWKVYNPNLPDWVVNDLTSITRQEGYWVKMNSTETYFKDGVLPVTDTISLTAGYNLVGYPDNETKNVTNALQSIDGNYSKIVGHDNVNKAFLIYIAGSGGNLTDIEPNKGYWINMTAADDWVIN